MSVLGGRVNVTAGTVAIVGSDADQVSVLVRNTDSAATVDIGGAAVAAGAGYRLLAGAAVAMDLYRGETLYGVVSSGTVVVDVLESGVG